MCFWNYAWLDGSMTSIGKTIKNDKNISDFSETFQYPQELSVI